MVNSDAVVSLRDYLRAVSRADGSNPNGTARPWREFVLVDEREMVLHVFRWRRHAVEVINQRFDRDPTAVERLRLVVVDASGQTFDDWPRGGTPAERAGALARRLSAAGPASQDALERAVRAHFLRCEGPGWTHIAGEQRRSNELWWWTPGGEHEPVGLLVERAEEGAWQLLLDGRSRGLTDRQLYLRVAQVMRHEFGDGSWTEAQIARVADASTRGEPLTDSLGPAALCVRAQLRLATVLHVQEPLGRAWP